MQLLVELSRERSRMSATRSYMNAERTLSVWLRTALSAMIFGLAIDRFGLYFRGLSHHPATLFGQPSTLSTLTGSALVAFSVVMSLSAGLRFIIFARHYGREFPYPAYHTGWLPFSYALMIAGFGIVVAIMMWDIG